MFFLLLCVSLANSSHLDPVAHLSFNLLWYFVLGLTMSSFWSTVLSRAWSVAGSMCWRRRQRQNREIPFGCLSTQALVCVILFLSIVMVWPCQRYRKIPLLRFFFSFFFVLLFCAWMRSEHPTKADINYSHTEHEIFVGFFSSVLLFRCLAGFTQSSGFRGGCDMFCVVFCS